MEKTFIVWDIDCNQASCGYIYLKLMDTVTPYTISTIRFGKEFLYYNEKLDNFGIITNIGVLYPGDSFIGSLNDHIVQEFVLEDLELRYNVTGTTSQWVNFDTEKTSLKLLKVLYISNTNVALFENRKHEQFVMWELTKSSSTGLRIPIDGRPNNNDIFVRINECFDCTVSKKTSIFRKDIEQQSTQPHLYTYISDIKVIKILGKVINE